MGHFSGRALAAALLLLAAPAAAQSGAAAEALFQQGLEAMDRGDLKVACQRFRASVRLEASPGGHFNLAECEEQRGRYASAWLAYRTAADSLAQDDPRRAIAEERVRSVSDMLPYITLEADPKSPADLEVHNEDAVYTRSSFDVPLPVDPGELQLTVHARGYADRLIEVRISPGEKKTITVAPGKAQPADKAGAASESPSGSTSPEPDDTAAEPEEGGGINPLVWVFGGVGVAALGTSLAFELLGASEETELEETCAPNCTDAAVDSPAAKYTTATVLFAVGLASVGAGATFLVLDLTADDSRTKDAAWVKFGLQGVTGGCRF